MIAYKFTESQVEDNFPSELLESVMYHANKISNPWTANVDKVIQGNFIIIFKIE